MNTYNPHPYGYQQGQPSPVDPETAKKFGYVLLGIGLVVAFPTIWGHMGPVIKTRNKLLNGLLG